jgi:hypothetical protein
MSLTSTGADDTAGGEAGGAAQWESMCLARVRPRAQSEALQK